MKKVKSNNIQSLIFHVLLDRVMSGAFTNNTIDIIEYETWVKTHNKVVSYDMTIYAALTIELE